MEKKCLKCLKNFSFKYLAEDRKPLLAFSAGIDSSALFFILLENKIKFDIAFVNYGVRKEAIEEERYAMELARKYNIKVYVARAPKFDINFEAEARHFRYDFFESLMDRYGYDVLVTAHQLNDRLEWMMMRLIRGAGVKNLSGMKTKDTRRTAAMKEYMIVRPLLECTKNELINYLHEKKLNYFVDMSNHDLKYERNYFRKWFCDQMAEEYADGLRRSFRYLQCDRKILESMFKIVWSEKRLNVLELKHPEMAAMAAGTVLEKLGHAPTFHERELFGTTRSVIVGRKWVVERSGNYQYIAPYIRGVFMDKTFKERCRKAGLPEKIRPYCYKENINPERLLDFTREKSDR